MSTQQPHPTADVDNDTTDTLDNQPMELRKKNRIYTTADQRQRLGISYKYGRGTTVAVVVSDVERYEPYTIVQTAAFETQLRYYGEIGVPQEVIDELDLDVGDNLRVKIIRLDEPIDVTLELYLLAVVFYTVNPNSTYTMSDHCAYCGDEVNIGSLYEHECYTRPDQFYDL